jgi:hypothetical protein
MSAALLSLLFAQAEVSTSLVPEDLPDAERRVIVDYELGFGPVFGALSGEPDEFGIPLDDASLEKQNLFLDGHAALGTRGILWPTLNLYGLGIGTIDLRGVPGRFPREEDVPFVPAAHSSIAHRYEGAQLFLLPLAYAEMEGITEDGLLRYFHLRAGRQHHHSRIGTTFDGVTVGFDHPVFQVALRAGSRSSVWDLTQDQRRIFEGGILAGGDVGVSLGDLLPLEIRADVLFYRRNITLFDRDRPLEGDATEIEQTTVIGDLRLEYAALADLSITAGASFAFPAITHVTAGLEWTLEDGILVLADFDQKIGRDLFFDLAGGRGLSRNGRFTTFETFRLNIVDPRPYTALDLSAVVSLMDWLELEPRFGFRFRESDLAETSPYDASRVSYGLTAYGNFRLARGHGVESYAGFEGSKYFRGNGAGGNFADLAGGGEDLTHDVFAGLEYVFGGGFRGRRLLSERVFSLAVQGFLRLTRFGHRYVGDPLDETAAGFGVDATWQPVPYVGVSAGYELAKDSSLFYDDLDLFHAVRGALEGSF